jgi:hypothetical protein
VSRFFRARLPAPKAYLVMCRLAYVAAFLAQPVVTIGDVGRPLELLVPPEPWAAHSNNARVERQ